MSSAVLVADFKYQNGFLNRVVRFPRADTAEKFSPKEGLGNPRKRVFGKETKGQKLGPFPSFPNLPKVLLNSYIWF